MRIRSCPALIILLCGALALLPAARALAGAQHPPTQAAAKQKLAAVKARIAKLAQAERSAAARRSHINAKLAQQADALAAASNALRKADAALARNQDKLKQLSDQQHALEGHLTHERTALAELLRASYALGRRPGLRLLLGVQDWQQLQRNLGYARLITQARGAVIGRINDQLAELTRTTAALNAQRQVLDQARAKVKQQQDALQAQRQQQQKLLARAEHDIRSQHQQLTTLHQQQQALTKLIAQLDNALADIPRNLASELPFAQLHGKLPWPVTGAVHDHVDGIDIQVKRGSPVHAVAHGRVVYANWLRGYGLLVIIEHGDGWMSLYGNNESALVSVGDWVNAGQTIATSGAGEGGVAGVYFGLRHHGKAVDPRGWLGKR